MILRTELRDCLLLHWALPFRQLPALPPPLRYDGRMVAGEKVVPVVGLLFHQEGFRLAALPVLRLSYAQFCLALAIIDGNGVPAFYFRRILLPNWLVPAARLMSTPPVATARLEYDRPSKHPDAEGWHWKVECEAGALTVEASLAAPGPTPLFASWQSGVDYFLSRRRGYYQTSRGFRFLETCLPEVDAWPLSARVEGEAVLRHWLPLPSESSWPELAGAMLFPGLGLDFERSLAPALQIPTGVPQPAPSSRSML